MLKLWPTAGCEAKFAAEWSSYPLLIHVNNLILYTKFILDYSKIDHCNLLTSVRALVKILVHRKEPWRSTPSWLQNSFFTCMGESWPINTESIVPQLFTDRKKAKIPAWLLTSQEAEGIPGSIMPLSCLGNLGKILSRYCSYLSCKAPHLVLLGQMIHIKKKLLSRYCHK